MFIVANMNLDPGLAVVIVSVLIFYLRLIILQRERVKRAAQPVAPAQSKKKDSSRQPKPPINYSLLSLKPKDRLIAGTGALLMVIGLLLNNRLLPLPALQDYWWLPMAVGIVGFSWAFKL